MSTRQKGNPILNNIKSMPWEYGDIPADYILGLTTCALFLSLKYHRIHPEYIYTRIKALQGKYLLRIVLVLVDIQNHEESLRELSKTSLINNVTLILCWSSAEGARYLELFKTYENAPPTSIKQHQSNAYSDRLVDFVTTPRSINKADAVSLVSQFGSIRTAVNARHEDVCAIAGWGDKKVKAWCGSVREPFRVQKAAKRGLERHGSVQSRPISPAPQLSRAVSEKGNSGADVAVDLRGRVSGAGEAAERSTLDLVDPIGMDEDLNEDGEEALAEMMSGSAPSSTRQDTGQKAERQTDPQRGDGDSVGDGVMAALNKLRKEGA